MWGIYISFVDNDLDHNNILYIYIYSIYIYIYIYVYNTLLLILKFGDICVVTISNEAFS